MDVVSRPYFYILQDVYNGMYYAGSKYAVDANPDKMLKEDGYTTTSNTIRTLIEKRGIDSFIIRKIKVFENSRQAVSYETRFLRKVNARKNPKFYNGHNNDGLMDLLKLQDISMELYGVDHIWKSPEVREKIKATMIKKYGVAHYSKSEEYKRKISQTSLEKYGVDHMLKSPVVREKIDSTMIERYGDTSYVRTDDSKRKNMETYGVEYGFQADPIKEKICKTLEERYGSKSYTQTEDFKQKKKKTCLEKYGYEEPMQNNIIAEKRKSTNLEKYGTEEIFSSEHFLEKRKETSLKKYGADSYLQSEQGRAERSAQYSGEGNPRYGYKYTLEDKKRIYAHTKRPFTINGVKYNFTFEAAEYLNLPLNEIKRRLKSKKADFSEWYYEDEINLEPKIHGNLGSKKPKLAEYNKSQRHRYIIAGVFYDSVQEAAKSLKVCTCTVRRKSKSDKYPDWICVKPDRKDDL